MTFDEFQTRAMACAFYPNKGANLPYAILGLAGETGEVAEKVKKCIRDNDGVVTPEIRLAILKELSDVMWYVAAAAFELNSNVGEIAKLGIEKLESRAARGKLGGSGDDR